jgi:CubicO group peptidase (beta-lactamase class C family)
VLLLEEAGRLRLAEPICTKVAPCPRRWRSIRIVDLLDQSAGLPDLPAASLDRPLMEVIDDLRDEPLLFPPGTDYTYSNSNYLLAGAIVEQASGMPWERFLRTKFFEPAGMTHTISDTDPKAQRDPVVGYSTSLSPIGDRVPVTARLTRRMGHATPDPSPAGGLLSTAGDLLAFVRFLDRGALLSPLTLDRMWTPRGPSRFADYGLGWERIHQNGTWVAQHGGAMPGFSSCVSLYPPEDVYVLVLSNLGETVACEYVGRDLGAIVFGEPYRVPRAPSGTWVSPRTLRRYSGVYRPDVELSEEEVQVMVEGSRLVLRRVPAPAPGLNRESVLQPWSPTTFFNPHDPAVRISFRRIRNTINMIFHRPAYKRLPPSWERWTKSPEEPPSPTELGGEGL